MAAVPADAVGVSETETETPALREQLVVFARELGDLYRMERERSGELRSALDELRETCLATIKTLAFVVEAKDHGTRSHLDRTHGYGVQLAKAVDPAIMEDPDIAFGFLLHDIGKVGVPESILGKPGPLTDEEWEVMRTHPVLGAQIVEPISFLGEAVVVIRHHHERFDGKGYPSELKGEEIPLPARIFSIVDSFDAMTSDRPYREALPIEKALQEVEDNAGTQFDPEIAKTFVTMFEAKTKESVG
ncbi:MAG: HD domain-containing phosphohydrolase [Actinomycetota bacterium]